MFVDSSRRIEPGTEQDAITRRSAAVQAQLQFDRILTAALDTSDANPEDGSQDHWEIGSIDPAALEGLWTGSIGGRPAGTHAMEWTGGIDRPTTRVSLSNPSDSQVSAHAESISAEPVHVSGGVSQNRFVEWLDSHALTRSAHHCAQYVRRAFEAAGFSTADRPASGDAGDYGPYLMRHGATQVETGAGYRPEAGDTAVFEKTAEHPAGHIEVFDGEQWVSDFRQRGFSPYRDPATTPAAAIYRFGE